MSNPQQDKRRLATIEDYEELVGPERVERIRDKARRLRDRHVVHVNSTYYGGGVAELLGPLTVMMNSLGIRTGWRIIQGSPDFFSITKKVHNALQGGDINLSEMKKEIYEQVVYENSVRNHLDHDFVFVHDPQPLALVGHYRKRGPWVWRCHVDLSNPNPELWEYLRGRIEEYDAVILTLPEYRQELDTPQLFSFPAIDAFSIKNRPMSEEDQDERLAHYEIPTDLPLVVQVSRFDKWKDPEGVIAAARQARERVDFTLVLLGNVATDDPEGEEVYEALRKERDERTIILSKQDTALVNALQCRAAVVMQKSKREGFGLTATEAMWKRTPVIAGNVGGLRHQVEDGVNGFLVDSVEQAAERLVELLGDEDRRREMGERARETVRERFLLPSLVERHLDLLASFESDFRLSPDGAAREMAEAKGDRD